MSHPFDAIDWPVRTERLLLRRATRDDLDATWRFRKLPEVHDWLGAATERYEAYRERYLREKRLADLLIVELDGRVIGDLMLKVEDGWAQEEVADQAKDVQGELGWAFDPAFGGKGYATEAARALVGLCFGPLRLRRVTAACFYDNEPSWQLMERLGMRREQHTVKESLHRTKGWLDGLTYALLAEEWPTGTAGGGSGLSPSSRWAAARCRPIATVRSVLAMIKRVSKILLPAILITTGTLAGCSAAASGATSGQPTTGTASAATVADHTEATHIAVWSVNSDGPDFQAILTGAVGDYGPGVTVHPDGSSDPDHTSELELKLSRGSFRVSIAALDAAFVKAVAQWPYNKQTCSIHSAITGTALVVAGSGTGAYHGITGGFTLTISLDEDYIKGPACSETTGFKAQLILISGTGSIRA